MLVLTRKIGQAVLVDPDYRIEVLGVSEGVARVELTTGPRLTGRPTRRLLTLRKEQGVSLPVDPERGDDLDTGGHQDLSDEVQQLVRALPGAGQEVT